MRVIGTAGHVDHGKSTLIAALTGTHPDRLKEERAREMTIDLGFASLTLPDGEVVGIVDVPGHRDFIENMLAGVGGIDAALFIIAADEGIMPQTREHLAILDILQIQGGVIVLNKIDLIDDPDWLDLVELDIRQVIAGTILADAPIVRVSARTGAGVKDLISTLQIQLSAHQPRPDLGRPRLPVDRVFTMAGFGTVVTGTLTGGSFHVGDELEVLPSGLRGRVRGLQTHNQKEDAAIPGSRTAINISGLDVREINRGDTIARPGTYRATRRLDTDFRLLADASAPVKHNTEVKLFIGTQEVLARLRLIGSEEIAPGSSGWLQLELYNPVVAMRGDRYILRRPSPGETLGGGSILDPNPTRRHKRFAVGVLEQMEAYQQGTPAEVLLQAILSAGVVTIKDLVKKSGLDGQSTIAELKDMGSHGQIIFLEVGEINPQADLLISTPGWVTSRIDQLVQYVKDFHQANPLRPGMAREELKSRSKVDNRIFITLIRQAVQSGLLVETGANVRTMDHSVRFTLEQERLISSILQRFADQPYTPPSVKDVQSMLGVEVTEALVEGGKLVRVSPDVIFRAEDFDAMLEWVKHSLSGEQTITAAAFRDQFNTSRKYALAFLEYLDAQGVTVREGDARRLRKARVN